MIVDLRTDGTAPRFSAHQRMVNAIVEITQAKGGCLPQDLLPLGFTKDETIEQWRMANSLAAIELKIVKAQK